MSENSEIYNERLQRYQDTVDCKPTDRVFAAPHIGILPVYLYGKEYGLTVQSLMEDFRTGLPAWLRYHEEFQPDLACGPSSLPSKLACEALDTNLFHWPGRHFSDPNAMIQYTNKAYMERSEYEEYIDDPTGFMISKILPRQQKALGGLAMVNLSCPIYYDAFFNMIPFALPPVKAAVAAMAKTGEVMLEMTAALEAYTEAFAEAGWPSMIDLGASIPFDLFNDTLRGLNEICFDMEECPDLLLAACEKATKVLTRNLRAQIAQTHAHTVYFFLHNGTDYFMSREQFETFYWPGLKAMCEVVAESGGIAKVFTEDKYDAKLDILATLPKGHTIVHLVNSDLAAAKKAFDGKVCFSGGVDTTTIAFNSKEDVVKQVTGVLDICAEGGGYIVDGMTSMDMASPENLHAYFDTVHNYRVR